MIVLNHRLRLAVTALILVSAYSFAFIIGDAVLETQGILLATSFGPEGRIVQPFNTGDGEHTRNLVITSAPDGRWWIMHAEKMAREGKLRIRHTDSDNPPHGREVHWSSLQMWNLVGLSKIVSLWPIVDTLSPIETAALFIGPLTLLVFLVIGTIISWQAFGPQVAVAFPLCLVASRSVLYFFRAGESDHHGLVAMFAAFGVILLLGGRLGLEKPDRRRSRWWFALAGIFSAAGLWVSAATQLPILFATGIGSLAVTWFATRSTEIRCNYISWRVWGLSGALASCFFYLIEYYPSHLGWRLEVNHPIYSLAWLAGAEILCRFARAMQSRTISKITPLELTILLTCILAVILPAVLVVICGEKVFVVSDHFLYALHDYFINEFMSLSTVAKSIGYHYAVFSYSSTIAALLIFTLASIRSELPSRAWYLMLFAATPMIFMTMLAFRQIRWSGTAAALVIPLVLTSLWGLGSLAKGRYQWRLVTAWGILILATIPTAVTLAMRFFDTRDKGNMVEKAIVPSVLTRDICHRLAAASPDRRLVILASPSTSTEIIYYGGAKAIGTLYWENLAGLRNAAEIYAATNEADALRKIEELGITHILLFSWDSFGQRYVRLQRGLGKDDEARDGFIPALLEGTRAQPTWLTPLFYPIPKEYEIGEDQWVRIYKVDLNQSRARWLYGVGLYQLDAGKEDLAERSFRESLSLEPDKLEPQLALLMLLAAQNHPDQLRLEVQNVLRRLGNNARNMIEQAASNLLNNGQPSASSALKNALNAMP